MKTIGEIKKEINELNNSINTVTDPYQKKAMEDRLAELNTFDLTGADNWEAQKKGETASDKALADDVTSQEIAGRRVTPQQANVSKGNLTDNKLGLEDTATTEKQYQAAKAAGQPSLNLPNAGGTPLSVSTDAESLEEAENTEAATETAPKESAPKRTIYDALADGSIDKNDKAYYVMDALATLAKNLGRGIGNVGAQFTGGAIDTNEDKSLAQQRQEQLLQEKTNISKEDLGGPATRKATGERLNNILTELSANRSATVNDLINEVKADAENATSATEKRSLLALAAMLSGANMNGVSLGATAATGLIEDVKKAFLGEE